VRINGGNARSHREHRFNCIAPLGEDRAAVLDGSRMRGTNDTAAMSGTMKTHSAPAPDGNILEIFEFFAS
jgi:hypothetical protein